MGGIQEILGHSNLKTTERSLHAFGEAERRAMTRLSDIVIPDEELPPEQKALLERLEGSPSMPQRFWRRKVERPPREELEQGVAEFGYRGCGKRYGVSDNCIRKWLKFYEVHSEGSTGKVPHQKKKDPSVPA